MWELPSCGSHFKQASQWNSWQSLALKMNFIARQQDTFRDVNATLLLLSPPKIVLFDVHVHWDIFVMNDQKTLKIKSKFMLNRRKLCGYFVISNVLMTSIGANHKFI